MSSWISFGRGVEWLLEELLTFEHWATYLPLFLFLINHLLWRKLHLHFFFCHLVWGGTAITTSLEATSLLTTPLIKIFPLDVFHCLWLPARAHELQLSGLCSITPAAVWPSDMASVAGYADAPTSHRQQVWLLPRAIKLTFAFQSNGCFCHRVSLLLFFSSCLQRDAKQSVGRFASHLQNSCSWLI